MSDFTKEELIEIYWKFEYYFDDLDGLVEESPLMKKIQDIIDNYDAKVVEVWHCEKCGHVQ